MPNGGKLSPGRLCGDAGLSRKGALGSATSVGALLANDQKSAAVNNMIFKGLPYPALV
jgi:hypothetical protein